MQKEGKTIAEINITIPIYKKIRNKKPFDGTPTLDLTAPVG